MAKIKQASPHTQLVVLTGYPASSFEATCRKAAAQACMHKDCAPQQMLSVTQKRALNPDDSQTTAGPHRSAKLVHAREAK
ncbi:hypothetical protein JI739_18760 [Ramlibacter sp. AW1]|uniref:Uncharacterized protein n=1 Tax=Ramlibacter aurantiacus TaxID=2801330 RepID=A0A936ZK71_9BURK|nr:hypothetical protein [Ramlibacter aurantiacus]MBL0422397.1 hypothetical protein [Ramlibacter aurantiacus]